MIMESDENVEVASGDDERTAKLALSPGRSPWRQAGKTRRRGRRPTFMVGQCMQSLVLVKISTIVIFQLQFASSLLPTPQLQGRTNSFAVTHVVLILTSFDLSWVMGFVSVFWLLSVCVRVTSGLVL